MKKNILFRICLLVCLVCLMAGLTVTASAAEPTAKGMAGDYIYWYFYADTGLFRLEGEGPTRDFNRTGTDYEDIPWKNYRNQITRVEISDGITELGDFCLRSMTNVESLVIPDSVTSIGWETCYNMSSLKTLKLSKNLTSIGNKAFLGCKQLDGVILPDTLTTIGEHAFESCSSLTSINIPDSVTSMGSCTFWKCKSLARVTLPANLTSVPESCLRECASLTEIVIPEGYTKIGTYAFMKCTALREVQLPSTLTHIQASVFDSCTSLESIDLPEGFRDAANYAFAASGIKEITFPESTTNIGLACFMDAPNLKKVVILSPDCKINNQHDALGKRDQVEIHGYSGSTAHEAAVAKGYFFVSLGEWKCTHPTTEIRNAKEATCTVEGYTGDTYCLRCKQTIAEGSTIKVIPHTTEIRNAKEATCTKEGYTGDTYCTSCKNTITKGKAIEPKPHTFGNWTVTTKPTADAAGVETRTCTACGHRENRPIAKLNPFVDVSPDAYYFEPVLWAVDENITNGIDATHFGPLEGCSRAHIVTFLWRFAGEPAPKSDANPFTDLIEGSWYYDAVLWAAENGITTGTTETTFSPNETCIRAQIVTFLWRFAGKPAPNSDANPFTDLLADGYYVDAVLWAVENGITTGTSKTTFSPYNTCERGQAVTFLYRHD